MSPTVLVVDDEEAVADRIGRVLRDEYDVRTAYSGQSALNTFDADVDVVLLDRRLSDLSGAEVLERLRARDVRCQVAMVTAVSPDFDVLEMPFDDYVTKPLPDEETRELVARLLTRSQLDRNLQEYASLVSKRVALERERGPAQLAGSEEFRVMTDRIARLRAEIDDTIAQMDDAETFAVLETREGQRAD